MSRKEAQQLKAGVINIHKMLELRKLHLKHQRTGTMCGICKSFCHDLGLQKETKEFLEKY
jgi:hypothetical protein